MTGSPSRRGRLVVALCATLLAAVTAVTGLRVAALAGGEPLGARGEQQWYDWSYRHPELAAQLARARAALAPRETVHLVVPPGAYEARWLRVMARYHLPEQALGGIHERGAEPFPPPGATTVALTRTGDVWVRRPETESPAAGPGSPVQPAAAIGRAGEGWELELAIVLLGAGLMSGVGLALFPTAGGGGGRVESGGVCALARSRLQLARLPLAGAAGLALVTPLLYLLWRLGLPAAPPVVLATAAVVAGGAILPRAVSGRRIREPSPPAPPATPPASRLRWLPWLPAAAAVAAWVWKLAAVPLWSWDHYAIWGTKARRLFPEGGFDPSWAMPDRVARPDYPLGLPLVWRTLTFGAEPGPAAFGAAHALMAIALVALAGWTALRLSGSRPAAGAAAALVAASPLLWDTESLGLADLPLALWAVAAVAVVAARVQAVPAHAGTAQRPAPPPLWMAGLCLGFLPWLKSEGLPLALGLLAASAVALRFGARLRPDRLRDAAALALPALALGAVGLAATPAAGDREVGFFRGDWLARGLDRLDQAPILARTLAADVAGGDWLGAWWLFGLATVAAAALLLRGRLEPPARAAAATALALAAAVGLQLGLYFATYLVSYIPAAQHAATSFHRVSAALAPLALLASAAAVGALGAAGGGSSAPGRRR